MEDTDLSMLDRVALAIYEKFEDRPDYAKLQMNVLLAKELALAAMETMREPTIEMEIAGTEAWLCEAAMEDRAGANYRAMIDEALLEPLI